MMLSVATAFAAFVAAQAASLPGLTPNVFNRELSARQDVPAACVRSCGPVNALISNNCPPASCCTQGFVQNFVSCYVCVASAANVTDYSAGEATIDDLVQRCTAQGLPIDGIPFPRPASGTTTTSSSTATGTVSTTSTTSTTISQTVVTSLTSPLPTSTSQSVVTSIDTNSVPSPAATDGGNSGGGNGAAAIGLSGTGAWVLALAAGMGVVLV